jgi:hypothetical protein
MKTIIVSIIFLLCVDSSTVFAQELNERINYIGFKFTCSKRVPYNSITIKFNKHGDDVTLKIFSKPLSDDNQWANTIVDTSLMIRSEIFDQLIHEVLSLNKIDLYKAFEMAGLDGTNCTIEFGSFGNTIGYTFWTPSARTEQRGLTNFLNLCKKIVMIGGFNEEILYKLQIETPIKLNL